MNNLRGNRLHCIHTFFYSIFTCRIFLIPHTVYSSHTTDSCLKSHSFRRQRAELPITIAYSFDTIKYSLLWMKLSFLNYMYQTYRIRTIYSFNITHDKSLFHCSSSLNKLSFYTGDCPRGHSLNSCAVVIFVDAYSSNFIFYLHAHVITSPSN